LVIDVNVPADIYWINNHGQLKRSGSPELEFDEELESPCFNKKPVTECYLCSLGWTFFFFFLESHIKRKWTWILECRLSLVSMSGALKILATELSNYSLDIIAVHEVRYQKH